MDARQMAAMAEATRLTRQGRLVEATALIQQTLASPAVTRRAPDASCAEEGTGSAPGWYSDPPPAPLAREGRSGWIPRLRTLPSRGASGPHRRHQPAVPAVSRPAARFDAFSYTNAAGTRAYRLYIPAGHTGTPRGSDLRKEFPIGTQIEAKVLEIDPRRGEAKLSIRACTGSTRRVTLGSPFTAVVR